MTAIATLQEREHINPDGSTVRIYVHPDAFIGDGATIGAGVRIEAFASIGNGATIGGLATIGHGATIGGLATIGHGATIGDRTSIGAYAKIEDGSKIGADVSIGDRATIRAFASIGNGATIGAHATIGGRATIGADAMIGACALIETSAPIRAGESLHWYSGYYQCDAYRSADGSPVLRHGCVTLPLAEWTPERQAELCEEHDARPEVARTLAAAVAVAQAFFAAGQQPDPQ